MTYAWSKDLETGYKLIDDQHRELVETVNALNKANTEGKGMYEIKETVLFLIRYANNHFKDEESLQRRFNYPEYGRHKRYHDEFKNELQILTRQLLGGDITQAFINDVTIFIGDWLVNHIKGDDFAMATYIRYGNALTS